MSSSYIQNGVTWDVQGIGTFKIKDIRDTLLVSYENEYSVRRTYSQTKTLPTLWANCLWLMTYDQALLYESAFHVKNKGEHQSVRTVRKKVLGLNVYEFSNLIGFSTNHIHHLEQGGVFLSERSVRLHLLNTILRMLSVCHCQTLTIRRLLHLARYRAATPSEHAAVTHLRHILIAPRPSN